MITNVEAKILMEEYVRDFTALSLQYYYTEENHKAFLNRCSNLAEYKPDVTIDFMKENKITYMSYPTCMHFSGIQKHMIEALKYEVSTNNLEEFLKEFSYIYTFTPEYVRGVKKETIRNLI